MKKMFFSIVRFIVTIVVATLLTFGILLDMDVFSWIIDKGGYSELPAEEQGESAGKIVFLVSLAIVHIVISRILKKRDTGDNDSKENKNDD